MTISTSVERGRLRARRSSTIKRSISRMVMLIASLPFAGAMSSPASADPSLINIPADRYALSPGGVDMRSGRYTFSETDLSIGGELSGLLLTRTSPNYVDNHSNPFGNFSHNWDIMIVESRKDLQHNMMTGNDFRMNVYVGGRPLTFESLQQNTGYGFKSGGPNAFLTYTGGTRDSAGVMYTMQSPDGTLMTFRPMGNYDCGVGAWQGVTRRCSYVSEIIYADGTKLTFDYAAGGAPGTTMLRRVTSSRGYMLLFESSNNHVTKACLLNLGSLSAPSHDLCPSGAPTATYTYATGTAKPSLASATDPTGRTSSYVYAGSSSQTMGFVKAGASTPWLVNTYTTYPSEDEGDFDVVSAQAFADGRSYTYSFVEAPAQPPNPQYQTNKYIVAGGSFTDGQGRSTIVAYDFPVDPETGEKTQCQMFPCEDTHPIGETHPDNRVYQTTRGPARIIDPLGRETDYDYCDPAVKAGLPAGYVERCAAVELQNLVDPGGLKTVLKYDGFGNINEVRRKAKAGSTLADIVTSATYDCYYKPKSCTKPTSLTDANGQTTTFTYSSDHGGVLSETEPADANGVQPVKRYSYSQHYPWLSNGAGGYVQGATPIWLLEAEKTCRTSATVNAACQGGTADEVTTAYEYGPDSGPNTLLLRGMVVTADGQSLRTCYRYDGRGNKIAETRPRAGLSSCP